MFPIRDHNPSGRVPYITYALMALNIVIFIAAYPLYSDQVALFEFYNAWAIVPYEISAGRELHTIFTSMFLHAGFMHLAGNMLFLFIFGDNMEDEMGHMRYLLFYLASGVAAGLMQVVAAPYSGIPTIGASGAIAGVMGGYLLLFPRAKVDVLIILVIFFRILPIPAWIMLGLWLGMQFLGGFTSAGDQGGVAYWAHAGGFLAGMILTVPLWLRLGGTAFWNKTEGHPPHPEARYVFAESRIPKISRNEVPRNSITRIPRIRK
ncbi:rhomboid family intramembrane serine protease [Aestuariivita boseongensis]|uniref:rhomboid family intramembrane serine protease n=1 Tax=Aestuariivita boseongensis TaxID=1470562 RepID=UPI000681BE36|nr:rhomboid family intramembrane serine protease [Aestuariivita boseongensis]